MIKSYHNSTGWLLVELYQGDDFDQWIIDFFLDAPRCEITYTHMSEGNEQAHPVRKNDRKRLPAWITIG